MVTSFVQIVLKSGSVEAFSHAKQVMRCVAGKVGQTLRAFGDLRVLELKRVGGMRFVRAQEKLVLVLWNYSRRARLERGEGAVYPWDGRCVKRKLNVPLSFEKENSVKGTSYQGE
jgi:hypothetical protein